MFQLFTENFSIFFHGSTFLKDMSLENKNCGFLFPEKCQTSTKTFFFLLSINIFFILSRRLALFAVCLIQKVFVFPFIYIFFIFIFFLFIIKEFSQSLLKIKALKRNLNFVQKQHESRTENRWDGNKKDKCVCVSRSSRHHFMCKQL